MNYDDVLNQPNLEKLDIEHICRICLKSEDELYVIFDEKYTNNGIHITRMIKESASCDVIRYDNYPHQICKKCLDNVYIAYNFRKQCQKSHILIKLFLGIKPDAESNLDASAENVLDKSTQTQSYLSYPCEKCDERFWTFDELADHNLYKHRGTPNVCKICKQVFKRPGYLRDHLSLKHPETGVRSRNQCKICFKKFSQAGHLQRHLVQVHKCNDVQKYMKDKFELVNNHKEYLVENVKDQATLSHDGLDTVSNNFNQNNERSSTDDEDSFPLAHFKDKISNGSTIIKEENLNLREKIDLAIDSIFDDKMIHSNETLLNKNCEANKLNERKSSRIQLLESSVSKPITNKNLGKIKSQKDCKTKRKKPVLKLICSHCDKVFSNPANLKRHENALVKNKTHSCTICLKQFASEEFLKVHEKNFHDKEQIHECKKCSKKFPREWHLRLHNKTCDAVKGKFKCSFENCTEIYNTARYLKVHIKKYHPSEKEVWICRYCQQKFRSRGEIQKHSKIHDDEKPHLCNECGKKFSEVNHLNLHIMRHRGEKRLKCKYCEKRFIRSSDLQVHEMYHTGVKPHRCETCGKGFIRACTLRIHIRTHTGEKPYKCSYCDRSFAQKQDMTAHVRRLHTGERYNCPICSEGYVHLYQLTQHKKIVHDIDEPSHIQRLAKVNPDIPLKKK